MILHAPAVVGLAPPFRVERLRSVRALRGIDSKVTLNKALWGLAERVTNGETLLPVDRVSLSA